MSYDPATDPSLNEDLRAFMVAIQKGDVPKARALLDKGVSPDGLLDDDAINPIHMAVANQGVEMAELLVERGARFRCDDFDHNELHIAARRGDIRMLQFLIRIHEQEGLRIEGGYLGEETPLHVAAEVGSLDCAQLLVRHGASIHARQYWLWTPLFLAAANPDSKAIPVLEFLINSGADVNSVDTSGGLPIWQAALNNNLEGVRLLCQSSNLDKRNRLGETVLHNAAYGGSLEMVQYLVNAGADIAARSNSNTSVLHRAAEAGNLETVKWLLDTHSSQFGVSDTTSYGWTPILFAACKNRTSTTELLLEHGADVGISPALGFSPLHLAAGYRSDFNSERPLDEILDEVRAASDNPSIIHLLIQHGADVLAWGADQQIIPLQLDGENLQSNIHILQKKDRESQHQPPSPNQPGLPLHCAASVGNLAKTEVLLDHSDDNIVNIADIWGATSLHCAATMKHLELLEFLISRGGDMNARNDRGRTVMQVLAFYNGNAREFLKDCGLYGPAMEERGLNVGELKRMFRSRYLGA